MRHGMARSRENIRTSNGRLIFPQIVSTQRNSTAGWDRALGPAFWRASPASKLLPPRVRSQRPRSRKWVRTGACASEKSRWRPMRLEQFDGQAELDGRTIRIRNALADFFGGKVAGTLDARLVADPTYEFQGRFDRVNLVQLADSVPFLNNRIGGTASGTLSVAAHGIGRENLIGSMEGNGC